MEHGVDIEEDQIQRISDDKWQLSRVEPGETIRMVESKLLGDKTVHIQAVRQVTPQKQSKPAATENDTEAPAQEDTEDTDETSTETEATTDDTDESPTETEAATDNNGASPVLQARVTESSDNVELPASPSSTVSIEIDDDNDEQNDVGKPPIVGANYKDDAEVEKIANDGWTKVKKRGAQTPPEAKNKKSKKKSKVAAAVKSIEEKSPQPSIINNVSQQ